MWISIVHSVTYKDIIVYATTCEDIIKVLSL